VEGEIGEREEEEAKVKHKKEMTRDKRIITDSIKDHLIPQVSSLKTPKTMFDALTQLFEVKTIKRNMTLRSQIKNVNMQSFETIQNYFKEKLEAIEDMVEDAEVVMTTLNGLPRSWECFIQGIFSRRKMKTFSRLWEECAQEEVRMAAREEKLGDDEDQELTSHTRKGKGKKGSHSLKKSQMSHKRKRDLSQIRCFSCQRMAHMTRFCPHTKDQGKKGKFKRHHAHAAEDDEPTQKGREQ